MTQDNRRGCLAIFDVRKIPAMFTDRRGHWGLGANAGCRFTGRQYRIATAAQGSSESLRRETLRVDIADHHSLGHCPGIIAANESKNALVAVMTDERVLRVYGLALDENAVL